MTPIALLPLIKNSGSRYRQELATTRRLVEMLRAKLPSEERRLNRQFEALRTVFFRSYWEQVAKETGSVLEEVGYGFYRLRRNGQQTYVRRGEVALDDHLTLDIAGNKPLVNRLLQEQGHQIPVFLEYELKDIDQALDFMKGHAGNCVVKPANGAAGGRGITTAINTRERLIKASCKAAAYSSNSRLLIEKQHPGLSYRLLYLDGEFLDALRRESPQVTGDGSSSIRKLVELENRARLASSPAMALSPLTLDLDAQYTLADQGLSVASVAREGERVRIKTASNQYSRRENQSVRDSVHPSIIDFGREISKVINVSLAGVDLMLTDHTVPLEQSGCVVNEINTTPGLHHHALISDPVQTVNVGTSIINNILNRTSRP